MNFLKKQVIWLLSCLLIASSAHSVFESEQFSSKQIGHFVKELMVNQSNLKGWLFVFDLDDTVFSHLNGQMVSSSPMFYDYLDRALAHDAYKGKELIEVSDAMGNLFVWLHDKVDVELTDPSIAEQIDAIKQAGGVVIGLTARQENSSKATLNSLKKLGVSFSNLEENRIIQVDEDHTVSVKKEGIAFMSGGGNKGHTLMALLFNHVVDVPQHVVFFDDLERHLRSVTESLKAFGGVDSLKTVHSTYIETKEPYSSEKADRQMIQLLKEENQKNDPILQNFLRSDPYTHFILKRCIDSMHSDLKEDCQSLLDLHDH